MIVELMGMLMECMVEGTLLDGMRTRQTPEVTKMPAYGPSSDAGKCRPFDTAFITKKQLVMIKFVPSKIA